MTSITFNSTKLTLHGVLSLPDHYQTGVLFLHGGGHSTNFSRYTYLQKQFSHHQIASLAFDFRGCGQSGGRFETGSLANRLSDAESALKVFIQKSKLPASSIYLWGSSMGGHLACRLTENHLDLKGIILQSAAAYAPASETLPLNHQFTQVISTPNSWVDSPAFSALEAFPGKILVVYGENDTVVPKDLQHRYHSIAQTRGGQSVILPGGVHSLLRPQTPLQTAVLEKLADLGGKFISST